MIEKKGHEIIIGGKTDPVFGPVISVRYGRRRRGTLQRLFHRASTIKYHPYSSHDGRNKSLPLLKGYRNTPPVDLKKLDETVLLFSQLLVDFPQIKEIDINPLLIN